MILLCIHLCYHNGHLQVNKSNLNKSKLFVWMYQSKFCIVHAGTNIVLLMFDRIYIYLVLHQVVL